MRKRTLRRVHHRDGVVKRGSLGIVDNQFIRKRQSIKNAEATANGSLAAVERIPGKTNPRLEILVCGIVGKGEVVQTGTIAGGNTGAGIAGDGRQISHQAVRLFGNGFHFIAQAEV